MPDFQPAFDLLDNYLTRRMESTSTPGLALAILDGEKYLHTATYGFANLETQTLLRPDTLFGIGSITKTFTAVAVLQAAEPGLLDLQAPVTDYLPWFQVQSKFAPIAIHHLLAHTAGIVGIIDRSPDMRGAVWALRETEAAWPPGAQFYYSDAGYQTLALVLEEVMGKPFPDIIRSNIFDPLEMTASEPAFTHRMRSRTAQGYNHLFDDRPHHSSHPLVHAPWIEMDAGDCSIASTAEDMAKFARMSSTAEDMAKFARMLLKGGQGPCGPLLLSASYDMLTQRAMMTSYGFAYGYGVEIHQREGLTYIGHGGGMPGYEAFMLVNPHAGLGVVLLSTRPSIGIRDLAWKVMNLWHQAYAGEPMDSIDLSIPDRTSVENATDYVGTYRAAHATLILSAEGKQLVLHHHGGRITLEQRDTDCFYVNHPDYDRYLLRFGRAEAGGDTPGHVIEACYGLDWYVNDRYASPRVSGHPPAWDAYPGHYRAHIPWQTNFRVILRKGKLWLVWPAGDEEPLAPLEEDTFRVGEELSPERLRFSQIVKGQALCANYSGSDYYRFFVP